MISDKNDCMARTGPRYAPNKEYIPTHDKYSASLEMTEHLKATDGNIDRCEERTAHIWQRAQDMLTEKPVDPNADNWKRCLYKSPFERARFADPLQYQAVCVLHHKNGNVQKAKVLFRKWWRDAEVDRQKRIESDARYKRDYPEQWEASERIRREYGRSAAPSQDVSPERIKALKVIMQTEHPDKGGDAEVFHAAAKELKAIRAA